MRCRPSSCSAWLAAVSLCALACAQPRREPGPPATDAAADRAGPARSDAAGAIPPITADAAVTPADAPPADTAPPLADAPAPVGPDAPAPPRPDAPTGSCAATWKQPCDDCGGTIGCDGTCQKMAPSNLGMTCNPCGGTIQCDGACSPGAQPNVGMVCTTCGDTFQCDGQCDGPSYRRQSRMVTLTAQQPDDPVAGTNRACPAGFRPYSCDVDCRYADGTRCTGCGVGGNTNPDNPGICNCYAAPGTKLPVTCTVNEYLMRIGCTYTGPGPKG